MVLDYEYTRNLGYFLEHSDEDEVDSNEFLRQFSKRFKGHNFKWLDVGAGPSTKPVKILKGVREQKGLLGSLNVVLDIIEPSKDWRQISKNNFRDNNLDGILREVYPMPWEEFISTRRDSYDLITFFHSIYGIELNSLVDVSRLLNDGGLACIVVESTDSDLHKIKKAVLTQVPGFDYSSTFNRVARFLQDSRLNYEISEDEPEQRFYVDELLNKDNPNRVIPLSFIVQTRPEDYNQVIARETQELMERELRGLSKLDDEGRNYLRVPDKFIWIYKDRS